MPDETKASFEMTCRVCGGDVRQYGRGARVLFLIGAFATVTLIDREKYNKACDEYFAKHPDPDPGKLSAFLEKQDTELVQTLSADVLRDGFQQVSVCVNCARRLWPVDVEKLDKFVVGASQLISKEKN